MNPQNSIHPSGKSLYLIKVRGVLDPGWSGWFDGMTIESRGDLTLLLGLIDDQPMLRGVVSRLWDLNLQLISVNQLECGELTNTTKQGGE